MPKVRVAILGATGAVGQRFVQLLENHPWFEVTALTGSDRTIGQPYGAACRWLLPTPLPAYARDLVVLPTAPGFDAALAFSALPADTARQVEPVLAAAGYAVCSNASAYRLAPDVPLIIPEVNPDHTGLIPGQKAGRGWPGFILTNPNCTSTGLTVALKALSAQFGLRRVFAVSLQALSGAGYPGVPSLDIIDNVVPYIAGEEDKVETEPRKMLGRLQAGGVEFDDVSISAQCNRVAVSDGHLVCASVEFEQAASPADVEACLAAYQAPAVVQGLPSVAKPVIAVRAEADRPQPRLDRDTGHGMTTVVGRVRPDPLFHVKFVVLSHNTVHGAAGGAIVNGELLAAQGFVAEMLNLFHQVRLPEGAARQPVSAVRYPAVVMVHGWQGNESVMTIFERTVPAGVIVVNPRAPLEVAPQSYGWYRLDQGETDFLAGLAALAAFLRALPQAYPVDPARVLLMGFSQGAAISYSLLLQQPDLVFGVAGLAGFLPPPARQWLAPARLAGKLVFASHGDADETVPVELARSARVDLSRAGAAVDYHEYPGVGHKLNALGVRDLTHWLAAQFSPSALS